MKKEPTNLQPKIQNQTETDAGRRRILTIKVGALTQWVRDLLAIVLMAKVLSAIW